jgi:ATP-dependent exoDNAse (exonuclease V) beta subunit
MTFKQSQRFYDIDGEKYPSVTTILQVIAKPGLMYFYGKHGIEGAEKKKMDAADIGTMAHQAIEKILQGKITSMSQVDQRVNEPVQAFFNWREKNKFKPIDMEMTVYSKKFKYAGTLDTVGLIKDRLAVIDFKTSNKIWPEYGLQIAAYKNAYEEMTDKKINSRWVIRLDKKKPFFEAKIFRAYNKDIRAFKAALKLWQHLNA